MSSSGGVPFLCAVLCCPSPAVILDMFVCAHVIGVTLLQDTSFLVAHLSTGKTQLFPSLITFC